MRVLCVAEKPSIARSISQILSGGQLTTHNTQSNFIKNYEFNYPQTQSFFTVTCVSGHLTELEFYDTHRKWNACDSFDLFDAPVEVSIPQDKKAIEQNLLTQARRADLLMIWTDCDREGEHIGMEIAKVCRKAKPTIRIKRARFSAIIPQQIHNAAQHPVELDRRQADAVEARMILDLKIGAAFTRLQTLTLQNRVQKIAENPSVVSYGPCQFPTLGFVVQQYKLVKDFSPESFWYIYFSLTRQTTSQGEEQTKFIWKRPNSYDRDCVSNIFALMTESTLARVVKVTSKTTKKWKPLPLTTVELQKAGSRLLRLAPKKVLDVAEKLYQQGFVSYPRTETDQFDPQFDFMTLIEKQTADPAWGTFATSLQQDGFGTPRKGKNNDKAHPPIHPTAHAGNLVGDEKRVYEYITRRFLACCSKDAEGWETIVDIEYGGEGFSATGLIVREKNYLNVFIYDKWEGHHIPVFEEGEEFEPTVCEIRDGRTTKPKYLTEADLVTRMDKNGIGTDATIAQHIQTIIDRDYVIERMEGAVKYLIPSTLGVGLIEGYNRIGLPKNVGRTRLRRETERRMVQVCEGTWSKNDMLVRSLEQYKDMYVIVKREFEKVTSSVIQHLGGQGGAQNGPAGGGGEDQGGGDQGGRGGPGGDGGGGGGGGGGRGGRGGRGGSGRGGGRGGRGSATSRGGRTSAAGPSDSPSTVSKPVEVQCLCKNPAVLRTVVRETASKGRSFWRCSNYEGCGFFDWADETVASDPRTPANVPAKRPYSTTQDGISDSAPRKCRCNEESMVLTVTKESANKGRKFWSCRTARCGFFEWDDEPPRTVSQGIMPPRTESLNAKSGPGSECFRCNQEGHWAQECPNEGKNSNKRPKSFGSSMNDNIDATCYKCQEAGHYSSACPNGAKKAESKPTFSENNVRDECFKCGKSGHWSSNCPQQSKVSSNSKSFPARGTGKRGRGGSSSSSSGSGSNKVKRGGKGGKKKSAFAAADDC